MFKTSHTAKETIQQNPIHIDSKWFKNIPDLEKQIKDEVITNSLSILFKKIN